MPYDPLRETPFQHGQRDYIAGRPLLAPFLHPRDIADYQAGWNTERLDLREIVAAR